MRRRRGDKARAQTIHAKRRLAQRAGLPAEDYDGIMAAIHRGDSMHVHRQSARVTWHLVNHGRYKVLVVYDTVRNTLVTALPLSNLRLVGRGELYDTLMEG